MVVPTTTSDENSMEPEEGWNLDNLAELMDAADDESPTAEPVPETPVPANEWPMLGGSGASERAASASDQAA